MASEKLGENFSLKTRSDWSTMRVLQDRFSMMRSLFCGLLHRATRTTKFSIGDHNLKISALRSKIWDSNLRFSFEILIRGSRLRFPFEVPIWDSRNLKTWPNWKCCNEMQVNQVTMFVWGKPSKTILNRIFRYKTNWKFANIRPQPT